MLYFIMKMNFMTKKRFYVKHWKTLDKYYDELTENYYLRKKYPNDEELIKKRLIILRKIKHFLRYRSKYEKSYIL